MLGCGQGPAVHSHLQDKVLRPSVVHERHLQTKVSLLPPLCRLITLMKDGKGNNSGEEGMIRRLPIHGVKPRCNPLVSRDCAVEVVGVNPRSGNPRSLDFVLHSCTADSIEHIPPFQVSLA